MESNSNLLLSKEIDIKERETNLLRIIGRCRKLGIDISTDILKRETESQCMAALHSSSKEKLQHSSSIITSENITEDPFLKEPTIEEFGLTKERMEKWRYVVPMPAIPVRKAFTFFKPARSPRYVEGSPYLPLRSNIDLDSYKNVNECTFDCTPEVCQMSKNKNILKVHDENREIGSQTASSSSITPKKQNILPAGQFCYPRSNSFQDKSLLHSPKEPACTLTLGKFESLVANKKNEFISSLQAPNNHTPEEPELLAASVEMLKKCDPFSLPMPPSPKLRTVECYKENWEY